MVQAGARRPHLPRPLALLLACAAVPAEPRVALQVEYGLSMQPLVWARVGAQRLQLVFDSSSADMLVFVGEEGACSDRYKRPCYSFRAGLAGGTLRFCQDSSNCDQLLESVECKNTTSKPHFKKSNQGDLSICGLLYHERSVEALEEVEIELQGTAAGQAAWRDAPARLLVEPLQASAPDRGPPGYMLGLFEGAGGMLGAAGPTLSCRNDSAWKRLLQHLNATGFVLDLQPPPHAWAPPGRDPPPASSFWEAAALEAADEQPSGEGTAPMRRTSAEESRIVLGQEGAAWPEGLVWSQPKTGGEPFNDALHTFLMFHPTVCGVELLRNVSSHWLVIIDTSGPCLTLPPFIFDSVRAHVPMDCPFEVGEMARGRLCSPRREFTGSTSLPSLRFQLEDARRPAPLSVELPLQRLTFRDFTGRELLCVSREEGYDGGLRGVDMFRSHISFGSLAASALVTAVDLQSGRVGLAPRGNPRAESTEEFCAPRAVCQSASQIYYPPRNVCEDPDCGRYFFLVLDERTRTCVWNAAVPTLLGAVLLSLLVLDLASHRFYTKAIAKASEQQRERGFPR